MLFGLEPAGYLAANLALHLANTVWVYVLSRRLLGSGPAAASAATLFGASSIAFTPLHWASGNGELLSTCLALAATWLFLDA